MGRIVGLLTASAEGAYYVEDLAALHARSIPLAARYAAAPATPGFRYVREPAEALSVGLVLDDGRVAWGDCVAVAYSGQAGRDPLLRAEAALTSVREVIAPVLEGRRLTSYRELAAEVEQLTERVAVEAPIPAPEPTLDAEGQARRDFFTLPARLLRSAVDEGAPSPAPTRREIVGRQLHTAVRYGVSQALLAATALARGVTMAEVIAAEWGLPLPDGPIPLHAQSGAERQANADKMIVRRVDSLPHALIDDLPSQLGEDGGRLVQYVRWLKQRIDTLGGGDYRPTIHLDVHGALGRICANAPGPILGILYALERAARPYPLRVESPVLMQDRQAQIDVLRTLREYVRARKLDVQLVADEWANTLEDIEAFVAAGATDVIQIKMPDLGGVHNSVDAVLACQAGGVGAFLGGSCAETDLSARVAVHVALATRPLMVMARPGMGVDEAVSFARNEMARALAWIRHRRGL